MRVLSHSKSCRFLIAMSVLTMIGAMGHTVRAAEPDDVSPLDNYWYLKDHRSAGYGGYVLRDKLVVKDIDDDGRVEIISGEPITVTEYFGGIDSYLVEGMKPLRDNLNCLAAEDPDGDGISEIFAGTTGYTQDELQVISGVELEPLSDTLGFDLLDQTISIVFAHPNSGPDLWLYLSSLAMSAVVDTSTFGVLDTFFEGAEEMEVGDVTGNETKEIVYNSGEVYAYDGITLQFLYSFGWVYDQPVELVNVDEDPYLEIITGSFSGPVEAFDFGNPVALWELPTMAYPIRAEDVTGDGQVELVVIGLDNSINLVNPLTHEIFWTYHVSWTYPFFGPNVAFGDTDGDGETEMVIDATRVVDVATKTTEWAYDYQIWGPFEDVAIADLGGEVGLDIAFASKTGIGDDQVAGGWLLVRNAETHDTLMQTQVFLNGGGRLTEIHDVEIGDSDNDSDLEIAVLGENSGNSYIVTFDGETLTKESEFQVSNCGSYLENWLQLKIADVDNDTSAEIVAVGASSACDGSSRVWVLDGLTGATEWESAALAGKGQELVVANMDYDPAPEIAILDEDVSVSEESPEVLMDVIDVFDGITHELWTSGPGDVSSLAAFDVDLNGSPSEILIGTEDGDIYILESAFPDPGYVPRSIFSLYGTPVSGISGYQTSGGEARLAVTNYGQLLGVDPSDASIKWESPFLDTPDPYGHHDSLATAAIPTETGTMFLVGSTFTVYQFGGVVEQSSPALISQSLTVDEDGGTVTVSARRFGSSQGELTVDYATDDRSATDGEDYSGVTGSFIWADGDVNDKSVSIDILDDGDPELAEDFVFNIYNVTGGTLANPSQATITIVDDDSSTVAFTAAAADVDETAGTVSLDVGRTGDLSFAGSVMWATVDGTAVAGEDYTAASDTINWAAGNGDPTTIVITILDDALFEDDETFTVALSSPGGNAVIGEPSAAEVTISSDDVIELVFSAAAFASGEGAGNATITAWRTGATNGVVSADFASTAGTATAGSDYTDVSGAVIWADGDAAPKTFDVPLIDDAVAEADETVLLTLGNPTGGATIGATGAAELTIEDDDGTLLRFTTGAVNTSETVGTIDITVERFGGDTAGAVGVDFATSDDTATAGEDYVATSGTLTWGDGETDDKIFSVTILDDGVLEGSESLDLTLANPTGNSTLGNPASATITIADDEWVERLINTETSGPQTRPDVAMDADGDSVVVWESYLQDGAGWGIFGQRFDAAGDPVGSEFQVNGGSAGDQRYPAAAMRSDGSFTVVWVDSDGAGNGIRGRSFDASGTPVGGDFTVNLGTTGDQTDPDVAVDGSDAGVAVWQTDATGDLEIRGRRLDASGSTVGAELVINSTTDNDQQHPAVAGAAGGGFVVAWQSYGQDGPADGIIARVFAADGTPTGAEVIVNEWTAGNQISPAVGRAADGTFLVAWEDTTNKDGSGSSIRARWFDTAASPLGGDIQANTYWLDDQMNPTVACAGPGNALIAWESENQDGSNLGIFAQALGHDGVLSGAELRINTFVTGIQYRPAVADSASGAFWATWASGAQDGSSDGIYGLFSAAPVVTLIFADGFESGNTSAWAGTTP